MKYPVALCALMTFIPFHQSLAQESEVDEIIVVSPLGQSTARKTPYLAQSLDADTLARDAYSSLADLLDKKTLGVNLNHAQNNPLQADVQVRGYSASPLLGVPQGVAVYMNGVRINESFGDTVNFDLLAPNIFASAELLSGANPSYGLNALGGSLVLRTKTGFNHERTEVGYGVGSFDRQRANVSHGTNNGQLGYFVALDSFTENGWRDFSATEAYNAYAAISGRSDNSEWDLYGFVSDTDLRGNGATPEELLEDDYQAVFTHPDITENDLAMLSGRWQWQNSETQSWHINGFYRQLDTDSFNGDGSEFEECEPPLDDDFLCEDDEDELVLDQFGDPVTEDFDAINNISQRPQDTVGLTLETRLRGNYGSRPHQSSFGFDYYHGETEFDSVVEFAQLQNDRSTSRSGLFADEFATALDSTTRTFSLYWLDRVQWNEKLSLDFSLRYNRHRVRTADRSGETPELSGNHRFNSINAGVGGYYQIDKNNSWYVGVYQSSRVPTPIELACSEEDAPCSLPNTFLADPPLDEVVARNLELGFQVRERWQVNAFYSAISDDIIFQSTGGVSSNEGFFDNVSDTQRLGVSAQWQQQLGKLALTLGGTWLAATFEDDFFVSSPNHPDAVNDQIAVSSGDHIPGIPSLQINVDGRWQLHSTVEWAWSLNYQNGVYLRGDEGNLDDKTDAFVIADTALLYEPTSKWQLSFSINNVFDREYETFGLYGEPDEVLPELGDDNSRFLSPSEPRNIRFALRYEF